MPEYYSLRDSVGRTSVASRLEERFEQQGIDAGGFDARKCLSYLNESLVHSSEKLLSSYLSRWKSACTPDQRSMRAVYDALRSVLLETVDLKEQAGAIALVDRAFAMDYSSRDLSESLILPETRLGLLAERYLAALLASDRRTARRLIFDELEAGAQVCEVYLQVFQTVQHEVGRLWQLNRLSVAEEHYCTVATQSIMNELYPRLITSRRVGRTMVAACVSPDLHEIGIRMVADFFEMAGWDTYCIGAGVSYDEIVRVVSERQPALIALSITMPHNAPALTNLIRRIRTDRSCPFSKIMVGGLPFNVSPGLWRETGADLWAADGELALQAAGQLFGL